MNRLLKTSDYILKYLKNSEGLFSSIPNGKATLYGTCYSLLTLNYLDSKYYPNKKLINFIRSCQIETGEFVGPELDDYFPSPKIKHNREHLIFHCTCLVLSACIHFSIPIKYKLSFFYKFCDINYLHQWLENRDFSDAWFEGNNLLFIGQLLIYLRDYENSLNANVALGYWFHWLDNTLDTKTGLWGTNGFCSKEVAVYGAYHQLLVYYYENHKISNPKALVDIVLSLQHLDGGFNPNGNGGACEDVDCVDILVNLYKIIDYRRSDIRIALRRCMKHIISLQNSDGGFPYNRNNHQSHMGIPETSAPPNVSTAFSTWFRIHTLSLISEVLPNEELFDNYTLGFTNNISMGWHRSWDIENANKLLINRNTLVEQSIVYFYTFRLKLSKSISVFNIILRKVKKIIKHIILR